MPTYARSSTAGLNFEIRGDLQQAERELAGIKHGARKAVMRALNRTIRSANTYAVRAIARNVRQKQKDIRRHLRVKRASLATLQASVEATGKRIPIIAMNPRQTKAGVTYPGQMGGRRIIRGAFIATMQTGHRGVFMRRGDKVVPRHGRYAGRITRSGQPLKRQRIYELYGPSVPHVMVSDAIYNGMVKSSEQNWRKNIRHEIDHLLTRAQANG